MYKHILIACDGSDLSRKALGSGLALARHLEATVMVVTVTEPLYAVFPGEIKLLGISLAGYKEWAESHAKSILDEAQDLSAQYGVAMCGVHVADEFPAEGIMRTAKECGADLIVMASHGRRGFERLVLGSETNRVLTQSSKPVLIIR